MSLFAGTPAPLFSAPSPVNPRFAFGSLGGRYILLGFLPEPGPQRDAALKQVHDNAALFRDDRLLFFGVLPDAPSLAQALNQPPYRWLGDLDGDLRRKYDLLRADGSLEPHWVVIDPSLRIMGSAALDRGESVMQQLAKLGDPDAHAGVPIHAPVLIVPRVFEPPLCRRLIDYYQAAGGQPSGVMRNRNGKTVGVLDQFKKRRDATITDEGLIAETRGRIYRRLQPEIEKAFQFKATKIERYIVACYDAEEGGYFNPHRDNTTPGTAHRRFAVSINLNAEEFEGGDLRFAEFGRRTYRPPTGGAVVFSCSLLHEATPVTRGTRYAFLPFLYDDEGESIRQANLDSFETEQPSNAGAQSGVER
jgi:predicted 2-oxoglutarate/Fe(II)-dependent dioxygenase YbiX